MGVWVRLGAPFLELDGIWKYIALIQSDDTRFPTDFLF
jgi:hypothetical protein